MYKATETYLTELFSILHIMNWNEIDCVVGLFTWYILVSVDELAF